MIKLEKEILNNLTKELHEEGQTETAIKAIRLCNEDIQMFIAQATLAGIMVGCELESKSFLQGFLIALLAIEYQKIKDSTEELERIGKL